MIENIDKQIEIQLKERSETEDVKYKAYCTGWIDALTWLKKEYVSFKEITRSNQ